MPGWHSISIFLWGCLHPLCRAQRGCRGCSRCLAFLLRLLRSSPIVAVAVVCGALLAHGTVCGIDPTAGRSLSFSVSRHFQFSHSSSWASVAAHAEVPAPSPRLFRGPDSPIVNGARLGYMRAFLLAAKLAAPGRSYIGVALRERTAGRIDGAM